MSDEELDFDLVTSARQMAPPPALRKKKVNLAELRQGFLVWELTAGGWEEFRESGRVYDADGVVKTYKLDGEDFRWLAFTMRDPNGNRLWPDPKTAEEQLKLYGRAIISQLVAAANEVNSANVASAEGNSDETQSDSSPSS